MTDKLRINHQSVVDPLELEALLNAIYTEVTALRTLANASKSAVNSIINTVKGDYVFTTPGLAIGSTPTAVSSLAFDYIINGTGYSKAAVTAGTAPGNDVIPQSTFGAVAFDIGTDGTIDAIEAPANATGYGSAALAAAALPAAATDHARLGYVTATKSDGAFTFGTTNLNASNTTVAYTSSTGIFVQIAAAVATPDVTQKVVAGK